MASATVVEKLCGHTSIYSSWWFVAMWALLGVVGLSYIIQQKLFRRPIAFTMHLALIAILIGALCSYIGGEQMTMHIRKGDINNELPFIVRLDDFKIEFYQGTESPMDYISFLTIIDNSTETAHLKVSMNNVGEYEGYRFYQSAYDYDGNGTIMEVNHDPIGTTITYIGYFLLFLTMALLMILPGEGFRKAIRQVYRATAIVAILLSTSISANAEVKTLPKNLAADFCNIYVNYNERICPLQTIAKDFTTKLYGKSQYNGMTPEQVFTGWLFFPTTWADEPMIKIKGGEKSYYTFNELRRRNNSRIDDEKLNIISMLLHGELLRIFPYNENGHTLWFCPGDKKTELLTIPEDHWIFIKKSLDYMGELVTTEQYDDMANVINKIRQLQNRVELPSKNRFEAEKLYNSLDYTRILAMIMLTIGLISFIVITIDWARGKEISKPWRIALVSIVTLVAIYLAFVITLRGYVANHLPLTNGYETMQFMALATAVMALTMHRKMILILPFGIMVTGLTLLVSMMGESNPKITNLMPVLASPLLSIHVCVIMISYTLLVFMMLNGIVALIMEAIGKTVNSLKLYYISRMLLYPALFLLTAGIFIGAIWANQSWGRYWGWDPKEVWALITMMIYAIPLHQSLLPALGKAKWFHVYMVVAFLTVLMTYFGVNFLLGGLHSYANS